MVTVVYGDNLAVSGEASGGGLGGQVVGLVGLMGFFLSVLLMSHLRLFARRVEKTHKTHQTHQQDIADIRKGAVAPLCWSAVDALSVHHLLPWNVGLSNDLQCPS